MTQRRAAERQWGTAGAVTGEPMQRTLAPGKRTLSEALGTSAPAPVQRVAARGTEPGTSAARPSLGALFGPPAQDRQVATPGPISNEAVHAAAARGTATSVSALPHSDAIQRAFGRHDISSVQAHLGGEAAESARSMGAAAYASGNHVVFGGAPDLHTAAHEAAHVIQQRGGVQLKGGVGQESDSYEQHADAVADRVVAQQSAEDLLDHHAPAASTSAPPSAGVQARWLTDTRIIRSRVHRYWQQSLGDAEQRADGWYDAETGQPSSKRDAPNESVAPSSGDAPTQESPAAANQTGSSAAVTTASTSAPPESTTATDPTPAPLGVGDYVLVRVHPEAPRQRGTIHRVVGDAYVIRFNDLIGRQAYPLDAFDNRFTDVVRDPDEGGGTKVKRQRVAGSSASSERPSFLARHASASDPLHQDAVRYDRFLHGLATTSDTAGAGVEDDSSTSGDDTEYVDSDASGSDTSDSDTSGSDASGSHTSGSDTSGSHTSDSETSGSDASDDDAAFLLSHRTPISSAAPLLASNPAALTPLLKNGGMVEVQPVLDRHPLARRTGNRLPMHGGSGSGSASADTSAAGRGRKKAAKKRPKPGGPELHFKDTFAAQFWRTGGGLLSLVGHGTAPTSVATTSAAPAAASTSPSAPTSTPTLAPASASTSALGNLLPAGELGEYNLFDLMNEFFYRNSGTPQAQEHVRTGPRERVASGAVTQVKFPPDGKHYHGEAKLLNSEAWFRELDGALAAIAAALPRGAATPDAEAEAAIRTAQLQYKAIVAINRSSCRGCAVQLADVANVFWAKLDADPRFGPTVSAVIRRLGTFDFEVSVAAQYSDTTAQSLADIGASGWHQSVHPTYDFDADRPLLPTDNDNQMGLLHTLEEQSIARQRAEPTMVTYHQALHASLAASTTPQYRRSAALGAQMLAAYDALPLPPPPASGEAALAAVHARRDAILALATETLWKANLDRSGRPDQQVTRFTATLAATVAKLTESATATTAHAAWQANAFAALRAELAALVPLVDYLAGPPTKPSATTLPPSTPPPVITSSSSDPSKPPPSRADSLAAHHVLPQHVALEPIAAAPVPDDGLPVAETSYGKFRVVPAGAVAFNIHVSHDLTQEELDAVQPILRTARSHPDSNGQLTGAGDQFFAVYFNRRTGAAALMAALKQHFGV